MTDIYAPVLVIVVAITFGLVNLGRKPLDDYLGGKRKEIGVLLKDEVCPQVAAGNYEWWSKLVSRLVRVAGIRIITDIFIWSALSTIVFGLSGLLVVTVSGLTQYDQSLQLGLAGSLAAFAVSTAWMLWWLLTRHFRPAAT